ncbi:PP2C family protein-serine/threonine phosphatase [Nonomuraea sp. NPDC051941]|uniref:PP2C family protein-serine/threonine phosphatase n=1 Tax=Nonomuraea sp. NPDC051941 TaxID=3364373 RepID=UPI0037CAEA75
MTTTPDTRLLSELAADELPPGTLRVTRTIPTGVISYATHPGLRRGENQDHVAVVVGAEHTALVLGDGVGSDPDGGGAALVAVEVAATTAAHTGYPLLACKVARSALEGKFEDDPSTTTLLIAVVSNEVLPTGAAAWVDVTWVGDSNAWACDSANAVHRITQPHNPPDDPHLILRHARRGDPELESLDLDDPNPVRRLLLCSDGLDGYVEEEAIAAILARADTAERARDLLVQAALEAGGPDNVTVVVADIGPEEWGLKLDLGAVEAGAGAEG